MRQTIMQWLGGLLVCRPRNVLRGGEMNFLASIDTSFLNDFDTKAFAREAEIEELVCDLMNYIKNVDYCDEVLRNGSPDD